MALILTLVFSLFAASASEELSCYVAHHANGTLPNNAVIMTAEQWMEANTRLRNLDKGMYHPPIFCQKSHRRSTVKNNQTGEEGTMITFSWGGAEPRLTSQKIWTCTDNPQSTHGLRLPDKEVVIYDHQCNCCGTRCNDHSMDNMCNETPEFTHSCYSSGFDKVVASPELPADSVIVPATPLQFCYKLAHYNATLDKTFYMWGATNLGSGKECGDSRKMDIDSHVIQICTCCGPLCNGATMNSVNAQESCAPPPPPPQATAEQRVLVSSATTFTAQATFLMATALVQLL